MQPFRYTRPAQIQDALEIAAGEESAAFIAGGTSLVNQLRFGERRTAHLIDITDLPLRGFEATQGGVRLGALGRASDTGRNTQVRAGYPVIAEALLAGASPQIRNMATLGGNLLQGLRAPFYREAVPAEQRDQASSGDAPDSGYRYGPIFGTGNGVYGSDLGVALSALDAIVVVQGASGERRLPITEFYRTHRPGEPRETFLEHGELITSVWVPASAAAARSTYLKVRERASYAYLVVSVAAALELDGDTVRSARLALGGVAAVPWRAEAAERVLAGQRLTRDVIEAAAQAAVRGAEPSPQSAYKVELVQRAIIRTFETLGGRA